MPRNNDYAIGNLLDYLYHQKYYKVIGIDLSSQTNTTIPHKINFTGRLEKEDDWTMFLSLKSSKKIFLNFSLDSLIVT